MYPVATKIYLIGGTCIATQTPASLVSPTCRDCHSEACSLLCVIVRLMPSESHSPKISQKQYHQEVLRYVLDDFGMMDVLKNF